MIKTVEPMQLRQWLDDNAAVLIDVREPAEYRAARIPGAMLIPLGGIMHAPLPTESGKRLVVHCKAGLRAQNACAILEARDAGLDLYNLAGGIEAWQNAGLPVMRG